METPNFVLTDLVDKRSPCGKPTPHDEVLLLVALHSRQTRSPLLVRVPDGNGIIDQVWYRVGDIWHTYTVNKYTYCLDCPSCKDSPSWHDGCDENDEICWTCNGAGSI